jgi:TetR/AcrR family transcriptional repressor of nem operon
MPIRKTSREDILNTCKEVFHQKGYYNSSMADLAEACGLMKGSFYHYFASKEEIMKLVLLDSHQKLKEQVLRLAHENERAPKERLALVLGCIGDQVASFKSCLYGNTTLETAQLIPEFQLLLQQIFLDIRESLAAIYKTKYSAEESSQKAMQSTQQLQGAVMMMKLYDDVAILMEAKQYIVDSF